MDVESLKAKYALTVELKRARHRGELRLFLHFPFHEDMIQRVKQIRGSRWSKTHNAWHVPDHAGMLDEIKAACKGLAWLDYREMNKYVTSSKVAAKEVSTPKTTGKKAQERRALSPQEMEIERKYREKLEVRKYSKNTIKVYCSMFIPFLQATGPERIDELSNEEITDYVLKIVKDKNYATKTQNQLINAIKFYYEKVLGLQKEQYWLPRPRKESELPIVLSEEEVTSILAATNNKKHAICLALLYSSGLRSGELINLRKSDIDFDRQQIFVKGGKGKKDRYTILSEALMPYIRSYLNEYNPRHWFVEGPERNQYSDSSLRQILKNSCQKAGIEKKVKLHTLRHSFATHLMESGTDTMYIRDLLGHASVATTAIYSHVSNSALRRIKSPLDQIISLNKLND